MTQNTAAEPTYRGLISFYNAIYAERGIELPPHLVPVAMGLADRRIPKFMVIIGPGSGKALDPDTLVLTPAGWTKIRNIKIGSRVMTADGKTWSMVRGVFWQRPSRLYRITFADGRVIRANRDHLWRVYTKKFAKRGEPMKWRLRTTEEISGYLWHSRAQRWYVPLTAPVDVTEVHLPIHPYLLGVILGDGSLATGNGCSPVITNTDADLIERLRQIGTESGNFGISDRSDENNFGVIGVTEHIRTLRLNGKRAWEKSIPEIYLRGSAEQRMALLQGLMDTDGTVGRWGSISYCSTSERLAREVETLVRSLGGIAHTKPKKTRYTNKGRRLEGRTAYNVNIRYPKPADLFALRRKKALARRTQYSDDLKLEITGIALESEKTPSVCINIDHPDGLFLAENFVVTHNSMLLSQAFPTWMLGVDPTMTIIGVSGGEALVHGFIHASMNVIEWSRPYRAIFPKTTPDKVQGWSTERGIFVVGHRPGDPDASYWGCGLDSATLTGKHARLLILDDLHNKENSATADQCMKVRSTYYSTLLGRADPQGARFILAGRRFHEEDIYGHLKQSGEWVVLELPAERRGSTDIFYDVTVPEGLECCFSEMMPKDS